MNRQRVPMAQTFLSSSYSSTCISCMTCMILQPARSAEVAFKILVGVFSRHHVTVVQPHLRQRQPLLLS